MWWVGFEMTGWTDVGSSEYRKLQPYEKRFLGWNLNWVWTSKSWWTCRGHWRDSRCWCLSWQKARWNLAEWRGVWKPLFAQLFEKFFIQLNSSSCCLFRILTLRLVESSDTFVCHNIYSLELKVLCCAACVLWSVMCSRVLSLELCCKMFSCFITWAML